MDRVTLDEEITDAMRAQDRLRLSILRLVKNELDIKEKESGEESAPDEVVGAFKKVLKQTQETLEGSEKVGTDEARTATLRAQAAILEDYLPEQVSGDALEAIVVRVMAEHDITEKRDMGRAIALIAEETAGNCDKAEVARLVGSKLG